MEDLFSITPEIGMQTVEDIEVLRKRARRWLAAGLADALMEKLPMLEFRNDEKDTIRFRVGLVFEPITK